MSVDIGQQQRIDGQPVQGAEVVDGSGDVGVNLGKEHNIDMGRDGLGGHESVWERMSL